MTNDDEENLKFTLLLLLLFLSVFSFTNNNNNDKELNKKGLYTLQIYILLVNLCCC